MADIDLRVPVFDFDTGEFVTGLDGTVKTVTGSEAVGMIAVKAEETERGVFPVYGDFENEEENHVYGSDVKAYGICGDYPKDVRLSEVKRGACFLVGIIHNFLPFSLCRICRKFR